MLDWSIEAWGREVGAAADLARLFTEQTGLGFSRRTQARLFEARRRLAEGRSVTEVAHARPRQRQRAHRHVPRVCWAVLERARVASNERSEAFVEAEVAPFAER
ncbi:hypothetical protein P4110_11060 [Pseudomonas aeruginosa]|nr:hypothetical protein [Pseudomonas aeruginosa]